MLMTSATLVPSNTATAPSAHVPLVVPAYSFDGGHWHYSQ